MALIAIERERGEVGTARHAVGDETGDVGLKGDGDEGAEHRRVGAVEEGISDVLAVESRWDAVSVGVGLVTEGSVKVVVVASELEDDPLVDRLASSSWLDLLKGGIGDGQGCTTDLVFVPL